MKTIVVRYISKILFIPLMIPFAAEGFSFEGSWKTKNGVGLPNIYVCFENNGSLTYSTDENYTSSAEFQIDIFFEDIAVFSLRDGSYVYRKIVLLDRSFRDEMVGQYHIYDGTKPINTVDIFLIRDGDSCDSNTEN